MLNIYPRVAQGGRALGANSGGGSDVEDLNALYLWLDVDI